METEYTIKWNFEDYIIFAIFILLLQIQNVVFDKLKKLPFIAGKKRTKYIKPIMATQPTRSGYL